MTFARFGTLIAADPEDRSSAAPYVMPWTAKVAQSTFL